jgi:hypothetical protein
MVRGRWIPDEERRRMLASVPDGYRATLAKLTRQAEGDAAGLDAYLGENDPLGLWSSAVQSQLCASGGAGKVAALVRKVREGNPKSQLADEGDREPARLPAARRQAVERGDRDLSAQHGAPSPIRERLRQPRRGVPRRRLQGARANYARALEVQPDYSNAKAARKLLETTLK